MSATGRELEAAYARYGARLCRFLASMLGEQARAEDVLHDTFVRALRHGDLEARTDGWWFAIARNLALNHLRDRKRKREMPLEHEGGASGSGPPEEACVRGELRDRLRDAVAALDADKREAVTLHYLHGLTYRETAEVLGVPENTAKTRCHHGLRKLRRKLGGIR